MNKVLVAGIETVVGGNLAVSLARSQAVAGVSLSEPVTLSGCETVPCSDASLESVRETINRVKPQRIVFCGETTKTGWEAGKQPEIAAIRQAKNWITAARDADVHLTLISSGAVFTGPWMFHSENSQSYCPSAAAEELRKIETAAAEASSDSLIVRTHAFGWLPGGGTGWVESLIDQLQQGKMNGLDYFRHGSPILATDLTDIVSRAWTAGLSGLYHIAGAERANPVQFARRLAHHFQLPIPIPPAEFLIDRPTGFGCGETSLQTRKIRRALHVSLPMLEDGVLRLFQQHSDGFRSRVSGRSMTPTSKVA